MYSYPPNLTTQVHERQFPHPLRNQQTAAQKRQTNTILPHHGVITPQITTKPNQNNNDFYFHQLISNWEDMNSNRKKPHITGYCINLSSTRKLTSYRTSYLWQSHKHKGIRTCCCLTSVKHNPYVNFWPRRTTPPNGPSYPHKQPTTSDTKPAQMGNSQQVPQKIMYLIHRTPPRAPTLGK